MTIRPSWRCGSSQCRFRRWRSVVAIEYALVRTGENDVLARYLLASISCSRTFDLNHIAWFHCCLAPSVLCKKDGTFDLNGPPCRRTGIRNWNFHEDMRIGVGPVDLCNGACQSHGFGHIELCSNRVLRERWGKGHQYRDTPSEQTDEVLHSEFLPNLARLYVTLLL